MKWAGYQEGRHVHIIPLDDLAEHYLDPECWCHPKPDKNQPVMLVHNSMDRREHTREKGILH